MFEEILFISLRI